MKRNRVSLTSAFDDPLSSAYRLFFVHAAPIILTRLCTLDNTFRYEQRVIVFRILLKKDDAEADTFIFVPNNVYHSVNDVQSVFFRNRHSIPRSIEFSGICPGHHLQGQPIVPFRQPDIPPGFFDKPREHDREYHRHRIASWLGELILDVDLADNPDCYDRRGICECVNKKTVCDTCWLVFMDPARRVILHLLTTIFKFKAYFFVYSGRRGFHVWIIDPRVVIWTQEQRLSFITALVHLPLMDTPLSDQIYDMLKGDFDNNPALRLRYMIPINHHYEKETHKAAVFKALYPKFDVEVTKDARHNHKLPLVFHPETKVWCTTMRLHLPFVPSQECFTAEKVTEKMMKERLVPIERALDVAKELREMEN